MPGQYRGSAGVLDGPAVNAAGGSEGCVLPFAEQWTTALVNGASVSVRQMHRWGRGPGGGYERPLVVLTAPIVLSVEDVTAILAWWLIEGNCAEELADDAVVRELVTDFVITGGCEGIEMARATVRVQDAPLGVYCADRAARVFGQLTEQVGVVMWSD